MSDIHVFYVSAGLLAPQHVARIGESLWEFLWLISHETKMEGKVLNGSPISLTRIAQELGEHWNTAQRHLDRLAREGYVIKKRVGSGRIYSYSIAHSKKWKLHWEGYTKNGVTSYTKNGVTPLGGHTKNGVRVTPEMVSPIRKIDIIDSKPCKDTACIKCGGLGKIPELVPSKLDQNLKVESWVKCDLCSQNGAN